MRFSEYKYIRPSYDDIKKAYSEVNLILMSNATTEEVIKAIDRVNNMKREYQTMLSIVSIRNSIDTTDEFYEKEMDFVNEFEPKINELEFEYNKNLLNNIHIEELKEHYGSFLFDIIKLNLESFDPKIVPLLIDEGKLTTEYQKLLAGLKVEYQGNTYAISELGGFAESLDRNERKTINNLVFNAYKSVIDKIDDIYDRLVHLRDKMAKTLGYKNYIELGYKRLGRSDYNAIDVKVFRDQIKDDIVPLASKIIQKQQKRLGLKEMYDYDLPLFYLTGNPKPSEDLNEKLATARKMYHEMGSETGEFVDYMLDNELIDLPARKGKAGGGYCTFLPKYKSPFVFANFDNTLDDINVLTHEFGHAFQVYQSRNFEVLEYLWPTLESCEIHSMSMEFFSWPWMHLFFDGDIKYQYQQLSSSITFLPYAATVDEFQHIIYENPDLTSKQRKEIWKELEHKYQPWLKYDNEFLNEGNYWIRQGHIFHTAFYYIDYALAQNCAHQFLIKMLANYSDAFKDYVDLCKVGGSKSFLSLLKVAKLNNPFDYGTLKQTTNKLEEWLDNIDDTKL